MQQLTCQGSLGCHMGLLSSGSMGLCHILSHIYHMGHSCGKFVFDRLQEIVSLPLWPPSHFINILVIDFDQRQQK